MEPIWQKAAEFGITAFLLVLVLLGTGYAIWSIGNRVVDVVAKSLERQAESAEKTSQAVEKIGDLAAAAQVMASQHSDHLEHIKKHVSNHSRVMRHIIHAASEIAPHALSAEQQTRVRTYLDDARKALETKE